MTMREFIRQNRAEIDQAINSVLFRWDANGNKGTIPNPPPSRNDDERSNWIQNDEGLYSWARHEGVRI